MTRGGRKIWPPPTTTTTCRGRGHRLFFCCAALVLAERGLSTCKRATHRPGVVFGKGASLRCCLWSVAVAPDAATSAECGRVRVRYCIVCESGARSGKFMALRAPHIFVGRGQRDERQARRRPSSGMKVESICCAVCCIFWSVSTHHHQYWG